MLEAASLVFGERGYEGTTTDAVARAAGVSQAYIVRMFGSKQALFTEVAQRALARIEEAFRAAAADDAAPTPWRSAWAWPMWGSCMTAGCCGSSRICSAWATIPASVPWPARAS